MGAPLASQCRAALWREVSVPHWQPAGMVRSSWAQDRACFTHLQAIDHVTGANGPRRTLPKSITWRKAAARSGCSGTSLSFEPLPWRTLSAGLSLSS